jgi:hypothetical protein
MYLVLNAQVNTMVSRKITLMQRPGRFSPFQEKEKKTWFSILLSRLDAVNWI